MAAPLDDLRQVASGYDTDKLGFTGYLDTYQELLAPIRHRPVDLLELGVFNGGSLELWRDYLPEGTITGLDLDPPAIDDPSGRIRTYTGSQDDVALLDRIVRERAPEGFDLVIDDAAHVGRLSLVSFQALFAHVKPGGAYVVEDWGTGYWPDWGDGARLRTTFPDPAGIAAKVRRRLSRFAPGGARQRLLGIPGNGQHGAGMVGFVKLLVDDLAALDVRRGGGEPPFGGRSAEVVFRPGQVIVRARAA